MRQPDDRDDEMADRFAAHREDVMGLEARIEILRATLEQRSVVLIGPRSPFWKCQYCQAAAQTPLMFPHKSDCILSTEVPTLKSPQGTP